MTDISDCRCIACDGPLIEAAPGADASAIVEGRFACAACGKTYDEVWGVPYLFEYDQADFAGLIEIAANAGLESPHTPDALRHFYELMARYDVAENKQAFQNEAGSGHGPWLPVRYNEWAATEALTKGEDWAGLDILDVGAGLGFDAYRHVLAGANVTALEYSPVLTREGRRTLPMIRWIGGASHILPFADSSFDAVFCNAALHHMRDLPMAIGEMLRVLRPGGQLITTGDPYRADHSDADAELKIFDSHPDVLLGVNEQVPRFDDFVSTLAAVRAHIEPRLFTQVLHDHSGVGAAGTTEEFREWDFDADRARLSVMSGSLAMKVRLVRPIGRPAARQERAGMLRPATIAGWLHDQSLAMAKLAAWAPEEVIDRRFPGRDRDRFELLNGWQAPTGDGWRQAYRRARWFLRRTPGRHTIHFELRSPTAVSFEILLNGEWVHALSAAPNLWHAVSIDVTRAPVGAAFALEIRRQGDPATFEEGLFRVRRRRFNDESAVTDYYERLSVGAARLREAGWGRLKAALRRRYGRSDAAPARVWAASESEVAAPRPAGITFSIVTVSKNAAAHIGRCLESVRAQTYSHVEHVVIDGASRDDTIAIVRQFLRPGGKLISEPDDGIYHAMNRGLREATGEYVLFLGADDYLFDRHVLADAAAFLAAEAKPDFIYGDLEVRDGEARTIFRPPEPDRALDLMICGCLPHQASFARRDVFDGKVGSFDTRYRVHADYDWFLRALTAPGMRICHMRRVVASFAMGGASSLLEASLGEAYEIQNAFALFREPEWMEKRLREYQRQVLALRLQAQNAAGRPRPITAARVKRVAWRMIGAPLVGLVKR